MPATPRTLRTCALALAGLGLSASTLTALPAAAADGDSGSATTTTTATKTTAKRTAARRVSARVLSARDIAMRQRGDAYAYGAAGPDRFDCSGLIRYSYARAGFDVPRTSSAQAGHALMLHSPGSGQRVRISAPWTSQWFGGTLRRG